MLETRIPGSLFLPFRWTLPFYWLHRSYHFNSSRPFDTSFFLISTRPSRSCTSSFRFKPFMWLRPFIRVNSYTLLSFTCLFYCNSSISFVTSFLSFQFLPSVCGQVVRFLTSVLTFHLVYTPHSLLFPFRLTSYSPFVTWTLSLHLSPFIRCTSFLSFKLFPSVRPFLSFQLFPFIRYCLPFVSTLSFHSLLPSIHFNSDIPFVTVSLRFKSFISLRPSLRLTSFIHSIRYFFPIVSPFHLLQSVCYLNSFVATLSFQSLYFIPFV